MSKLGLERPHFQRSSSSDPADGSRYRIHGIVGRSELYKISLFCNDLFIHSLGIELDKLLPRNLPIFLGFRRYFGNGLICTSAGRMKSKMCHLVEHSFFYHNFVASSRSVTRNYTKFVNFCRENWEISLILDVFLVKGSFWSPFGELTQKSDVL